MDHMKKGKNRQGPHQEEYQNFEKTSEAIDRRSEKRDRKA